MIQTLKPLHMVKTGGRPSAARLSHWFGLAHRAVRLSDGMQNLPDEELLRRTRELTWRIRSGVPPSRLFVDAAALVREASRRRTGLAQYPVQLVGGMALVEGHVAEMQTGEGKTLTAVMPALLYALYGKGCHVITVNDYLAERDAHEMGPVYEALGLSVGCILTDMEPDQRRPEYRKDVTYGTAKEFGFDFLRDRLREGVRGARGNDRPKFFAGTSLGGEQLVQREHFFALVDEADSILVDEARTPLIIGLTQPNDPAVVCLYRWCHRATYHLEPNRDFVYEPEKRSAYLTDPGCRRVLLLSKPSLIDGMDVEQLYSHVEKAVTARYGFAADRDYVVVDEKVHIVDESTGRIMEGRKWQDGLHQAIEAKESIPITAATGVAARITVQSFFRKYRHLAGMTGTAHDCRREIAAIYRRKVSRVPTHRPCIRTGSPTRVFATYEAKMLAVVEEIDRTISAGRSVLVGTPSVSSSEMLGRLLQQRCIKHRILNARNHAEEADIVAEAGRAGRVTIATNMAGRGTDIKLDDTVTRNGGLHVIATEMHSSRRIDRQLVGRAARQGDPGSFSFFLSLDDELLRVLEPATRERLKRSAQPNANGELPARWVSLFRRTQRKIDREHRKQRKNLLKSEKVRLKRHKAMGLDPFLELTE